MPSDIRTLFFEHSVRKGNLHVRLPVYLDNHNRNLPPSLPNYYNYW